MEGTMEEDDVEVIGELNSKRLAANTSEHEVGLKKPRMDLLPVTNQQTIFLKFSLISNPSSVVVKDTEREFMNKCFEVENSISQLKGSLDDKMGRFKKNIEKHIMRSKFLLNITLNQQLTMRQNGLHPPVTYSQDRLLPYPGPKDHTPLTDGVQIVNFVPGKAMVNLPPAGPIKRPELAVNSKVYAMKTDLFGIWSKAVITDIKETLNSERMFRVKFEGFKNHLKNCTAKQIAYEHPPDVKLPFGKRIIAFYRPEDKNVKPVMYAGIIAEPPKSTNRSRYLIFFDDGFAQYIEHNEVRLVHEESKSVWEDIHPDSRDFIKSYCEQFPERPMLKLQKNQVIKTEFNSSWWLAKVVDIDASMVKMYFEAEKRYEWIYRGSTRLAPLYNELEKAKHNRLTGGKFRRHNITARKADENQPYVEYTRTNYDEIVLDSDGSDSDKEEIQEKIPTTKNTARKSTSQIRKPEPIVPTSAMIKNYEGEVITLKQNAHAIKGFKKHNCGLSCREKIDPIKFKGQNPLRIPLYVGWERHSKKFRPRSYTLYVHYRAPCGKLLRSINEIHSYLLKVGSHLSIDLFSFDSMVCPFKTFVTTKEKTLWSTPDITLGRENMRIECVNCLTNEKPPHVEYATSRFPGKGVTLNLDKQFLCGCDCVDNCQDPIKCQCRQLTIKAYSRDGSNTDVGYKHRRLTDPIVTGVYECSSWCKCSKSCTNRVVQNGIQIRLQMFKTLRKGWGIRCLDDVDAGMFLCIYAGQLLTEQGADEDGHQFGDEYLAELDHIEVAEKMKEGYESDVAIDVDDLDVEIGLRNKKNAIKVDDDSDNESDASSAKSSSNYSTTNSNSHDSDPEYEGQLQPGEKLCSYTTRSSKKNKNSSSVGESNAEDSNDSRTFTASESDTDKVESTILRQFLSQAEDSEIGEVKRKPRIEGLNAKKSSQTTGLLKMQQPPPGLLNAKGKKYVSIRNFFKEDYCYIMDAKSKGNIGRYLNHSCCPNSFVQNVFVDTHDLRFPTVAFFASDRIAAGTELTWDYNYEVGSVVNKVLYCHCESTNCRGRLL